MGNAPYRRARFALVVAIGCSQSLAPMLLRMWLHQCTAWCVTCSGCASVLQVSKLPEPVVVDRLRPEPKTRVNRMLQLCVVWFVLKGMCSELLLGDLHTIERHTSRLVLSSCSCACWMVDTGHGGWRRSSSASCQLVEPDCS